MKSGSFFGHVAAENDSYRGTCTVSKVILSGASFVSNSTCNNLVDHLLYIPHRSLISESVYLVDLANLDDGWAGLFLSQILYFLSFLASTVT